MKSKDFNTDFEPEEDLQQHFLLSMDLFCVARTSGEFIRRNPEWETAL